MCCSNFTEQSILKDLGNQYMSNYLVVSNTEYLEDCEQLKNSLACLFKRFVNSENLINIISSNYKCCSIFLLLDFALRMRMLLGGASYKKADFKKENLALLSKTMLSDFVYNTFSREYGMLKFLFNHYSGICESAHINPEQPFTCYQTSIYEMCNLFINAIKQKAPKVFQIYEKLEKNEKITEQQITDMLLGYY